MRKTFIHSLIILLAIAFGIWIGKTKFETAPKDVERVIEVDTAQINYEKEIEIRYPTYTVQGGLPEPDDKYRYLVSQWFEFRFRTTSSSCTNQHKETIDFNKNNITDSILSARIGPDWYERFEKAVDSLYRLDTLACHVVKNDKTIQKLIKTKTQGNPEVYPVYECYPAPNANLKVISVSWLGKIYKDTVHVSFIRASVDLRTKKIVNIEDLEMEWDIFR